MTELLRKVLLSLVENIIVYKDKGIKINFKFKDEFEKMISIVDTH